MQQLIFAISLLCLLTSCGPKVIYEQTSTFPAKEWAYADSARFEFTVQDVVKAYDLVLTLTHGTDFPAQNFYVRLHTGFPSGKRTSEQVSLQLAGDFGAWLGDCSGETCEQKITILQNAKFADPGEYYLTVEQYSREEPLAGIGSVGLAVLERE